MGSVLSGRSVFDLVESLTLDVSGSKCPAFETFGNSAAAVCEGFFDGFHIARKHRGAVLFSPAVAIDDGVEGALLRQDQSDGSRRHWQGERGAERMVRVEFANGNAQHYEGGPGATERLVRKTLQDGTTQSFEGERGAERLVRVTLPDGRSMHFEGARGVERPVRSRV